ncbi:hypothetical protein RISK_004765 [Rhodopirellula islandica]|uniref:Uncharacterized protein n=1 Tax=Rhodopirellula islandica TaxID=595434 RepID=A0A0J1BAB6_RHOIS|nr:hypothetical protein RISK_004765 [Rhodopirellula islandica]
MNSLGFQPKDHPCQNTGPSRGATTVGGGDEEKGTGEKRGRGS